MILVERPSIPHSDRLKIKLKLFGVVFHFIKKGMPTLFNLKIKVVWGSVPLHKEGDANLIQPFFVFNSISCNPSLEGLQPDVFPHKGGV
jgi:hypothetical protein